MVRLNLPEYDVVLKKENGKVWIFDVIRKKYLVLTPEEWVRQHLINYFVEHLEYPKALIKVETGLKINTLSKRADIVVYNREGNPWLAAECKSFHEKITDATVRQVSTYNQSLEAMHLVVSNGLKHYCFEVDHMERRTKVLMDFPAY